MKLILSLDTTADQLPPGHAATVLAVQAGRGVALRLRTLGLRPGSVVRALAHGPLRGPVILEVEGTRLALGRGIARRILVRPHP